MGIIKLPCLEFYWSKQYNGIETPGIARVMSLVRFEQLSCRSNRKGFPKDLVTKATKQNRGHYDYRSTGPLVASAWVDKRSIYFLSTLHVGELPSGRTCVVKRKQLDGTFVDLACPPCLPDYQAYMRGVDRRNQLQRYYNEGRRSKKWWRRVFVYIL